MEERLDIILRELDGPNSGNILHEIKSAVNELFPTTVDSAGKWIKAKGAQEVAKVEEIRANVISVIVKLQNERIKLVQERDIARKDAELREKHDLITHKEKMYALRTERLRAVIDCLINLRNSGVEVELEVLVEPLISEIKEELS